MLIVDVTIECSSIARIVCHALRSGSRAMDPRYPIPLPSFQFSQFSSFPFRQFTFHLASPACFSFLMTDDPNNLGVHTTEWNEAWKHIADAFH